MLTQQQVLEVFDSFGDQFVHHNALQARLRGMGHDTEEVANAVTAAVQDGALVLDTIGQLRRR
ncbi:hypothetical protein VI03_25725 [Burkholderia vietnamiensis]|uniref:hypothetical protein n=1 Tax=Burkholderia vietnamiensis TaxID=60552 RepID=UPI0006219F93|nr:hypothetical protein [Burkholderia vietnamiensis]KKI36165.1 hypothetical protein VI03_25725 [Burkholderia vietnamiensis]HDR9179360.1 hypothetical protein [Burkholderia vietnamiensis]